MSPITLRERWGTGAGENYFETVCFCRHTDFEQCHQTFWFSNNVKSNTEVIVESGLFFIFLISLPLSLSLSFSRIAAHSMEDRAWNGTDNFVCYETKNSNNHIMGSSYNLQFIHDGWRRARSGWQSERLYSCVCVSSYSESISLPSHTRRTLATYNTLAGLVTKGCWIG